MGFQVSHRFLYSMASIPPEFWSAQGAWPASVDLDGATDALTELHVMYRYDQAGTADAVQGQQAPHSSVDMPVEDSDTFDFIRIEDRGPPTSQGRDGDGRTTDLGGTANMVDGRPDPDPAPAQAEDTDPDPAPPPVDQPDPPSIPTDQGRPPGTVPGTPQVTPQSPEPSGENSASGRPDDAVPDVPPDTGPVTTYTSGGLATSSYNVAIEFVGTWSVELQAAFIDAAQYLSTIILADLPDAIVNGVVIDDISITATLQAIDGVGGTLGSAGPRDIRGDGSFLPTAGAMTFDSADAQNQLGIGNWETIVLHEMLHAMGFGTLWSLMGLTSGSVAGGDIRFTGANATDMYQAEFPTIAGADAGSLLGVPVETDGGPGTAGGHWDEGLFDAEIMTGFVDSGSFVSTMTIAALEDMGYDTVFDSPYSATDQFGPIPIDPLLDILV